MKCGICGNEDKRLLHDEDDTIYCSNCHRRTLKVTGEADEVDCPYCGEKRDRKAAYCYYCGNPWGVKMSGKEKYETRKSVKEFIEKYGRR